MLLKGPMPPLKKMKRAELKVECDMWRRLWQWVPGEVKHYVARTGNGKCYQRPASACC